MRVAFDAHTIGEHETGNEAYTFNLLRALAATSDGQHQYDVLTPHPDRLRTLITLPPGFDAVPVRPGPAAIRIPVGIPLTALRRRADVLHLSYIAPLWAPCPTVVTVHDLSFLALPNLQPPRTRILLRLLVGRSVRRAARVIAISEWTRQDLLQRYGLPADKVAAIHIAPGAAFRRLSDVRAGVLPPGVVKPFVLAVGNLEPRKNLIRVVEAFSRLVKEGLEGTLVLAGKPKYRSTDLHRAVSTLGLSSRVILTGYVTDDVLNVLYNHASVLVYPSLYEGFGLPLVEAMVCGCPVVASTATAIPEVVGNAALLVDPTSVSALADAVRAVLSRPELARDLQEKGFRQAASYSWERTARLTRGVYEEAAMIRRRVA